MPELCSTDQTVSLTAPISPLPANERPVAVQLEAGIDYVDDLLRKAVEQPQIPDAKLVEMQGPDFSRVGIMLSAEDEKLLKRLRNVYRREVTVAWLAQLSVDDFLQKRAVGATYAMRLTALQKRVLEAVGIAPASTAERISATSESPTGFDIPNRETGSSTAVLEYRIAAGQLAHCHQKLLRKLAYVFDKSIEQMSVSWFLSLTPAGLQTKKGIGETYIEIFRDLRKQVRRDLREILQADDAATISSRTIVVARSNEPPPVDPVRHAPDPLTRADLELALVQDFEGLLLRLDERSRKIALARWGYHEPRQTFKAIGKKVGLTRERVRQIAEETNRLIPDSLRFEPKAVWGWVRPHLGHDILSTFPNLASCFDPPRLLYGFLEHCCRVPKGSIKETQCLNHVDGRILDTFFVQTASPVDEQLCCEELVSAHGMSLDKASNAMWYLARSGHIRITDQGVFPGKLKKMDAIAHVLTNHPRGLPWKDVVRLVNAKRAAAVEMSEKRQGAAFQKNPNAYLCGLGTYRHLKFLTEDEHHVAAMIGEVRRYLREHNLRSQNLPVIHQQVPQTLQIDYYTLRHFVSTLGEERGLHFVGRSGVDTVSVDADPQHVNLGDVILHIVETASGPLTLHEIAKQLRSKSYPLAAMHVNALQKAGKVVRIDRRMFTTADRAFDGVDRQAIANIIGDCLRKTSLPVEADVFRERVNPALNLSYSKYFYNALAKTLVTDYGWYVRRTLFSSSHIGYEGLSDLFHHWFDPAFSNDDNLNRMRQKVWISDHLAATMIRQWMTAARSPSSHQ